MEIDEFLARPGAKLGKCNAWTKRHTPCQRWAIKGHRRCHRHGAGYTRNRSMDHLTRGSSGRFISKSDCNNL